MCIRDRKRLYELTEKNHIYDELEVKFKKQTDQIRQLLEQCKNADPCETMRSADVVCLFELLHVVAEKTLGELQSLFISVSDDEMNLSVECSTDLSVIASQEVTVCQDDGLWLVRTQIGG